MSMVLSVRKQAYKSCRPFKYIQPHRWEYIDCIWVTMKACQYLYGERRKQIITCHKKY